MIKGDQTWWSMTTYRCGMRRMTDSCQCMAKPLQYCKVISLLSLHGKQMGKHWLTLFWGGSKITEDGDCSHELKRHLLLGRKVMTNLDSILKSRDITLSTNVHLVKAMVFPLVMYGCESWTIKKAEHQKELMLLNCGIVVDSWESLGLQGDPTSPF